MRRSMFILAASRWGETDEPAELVRGTGKAEGEGRMPTVWGGFAGTWSSSTEGRPFTRRDGRR